MGYFVDKQQYSVFTDFHAAFYRLFDFDGKKNKNNKQFIDKDNNIVSFQPDC